MIEVVDNNTQTRQITLCETGTQTESPVRKEVAVLVQPSVMECESQTVTANLSESATQMSPEVKIVEPMVKPRVEEEEEEVEPVVFFEQKMPEEEMVQDGEVQVQDEAV